MTQTGLGWMRARGDGWKRPTGRITDRNALSAAWQLANPDLRMGGPAWSWLAAEADAIDRATDPVRARRLTTPILIDAPPANRAAVRFCASLSSCSMARTLSAGPFATGAGWDRWLDRIAPPPVQASAPADATGDHAQ